MSRILTSLLLCKTRNLPRFWVPAETFQLQSLKWWTGLRFYLAGVGSDLNFGFTLIMLAKKEIPTRDNSIFKSVNQKWIKHKQ